MRTLSVPRPEKPGAQVKVRQWILRGYLPFLLYLLLICMPGIAQADSISFSVVVFPIALFAYSAGSLKTLRSMIPFARNLLLTLFSIIIVFSAWSLVTAIGVESFVRVFRPLYGHASGIVLAIAILALSRSPESALRVRKTFIAFLVTAMSVTYLFGITHGDRMAGVFKHPNQLGAVASMSVCYFVSCLICQGSRKHILLAAGLVFSLAALFFSGSKTNLLTVGALSLIAVPLVARMELDKAKAVLSTYRNFVLIGLIALVAVPTLSLANERAANMLTTILTGEEEVGEFESVVDRSEIWAYSWSIAMKHPVRGEGSGQQLPDGTDHSHNIFMDAVRTTGFPGLFMISAFILGALYFVAGSLIIGPELLRDPRSLLSREENRGPFIGSLLALVAYLIANQMSDSFGPSTIPFFYAFLALASVSLIRYRPVSAAPQRKIIGEM